MTDLVKLVENIEPREPCTLLTVDTENNRVELLLDSSRMYVADWIKGEGADICLYRDRETGKVIGCYLPLYQQKLSLVLDNITLMGEH